KHTSKGCPNTREAKGRPHTGRRRRPHDSLRPFFISLLMLDSVTRGRVELRVRWDGGAKGRKSGRVPIMPKLAAAIKRYEALERPEVPHSELLINHLGRPYQRYGIDRMMDRLREGPGCVYTLQAHFHHGGDEGRLELRAPACCHGAPGLRCASAVC